MNLSWQKNLLPLEQAVAEVQYNDVAFSPDGRILATADSVSLTAWLWDVGSGACTQAEQVGDELCARMVIYHRISYVYVVGVLD